MLTCKITIIILPQCCRGNQIQTNPLAGFIIRMDQVHISVVPSNGNYLGKGNLTGYKQPNVI